MGCELGWFGCGGWGWGVRIGLCAASVTAMLEPGGGGGAGAGVDAGGLERAGVVDADVARAADALSRAEREVLTFAGPPFGAGAFAGPPAEISLLARRVSCRTVHPLTVLEEPGQAERIRALARLGGRARVAPTLPLSMVVIDRCEALVCSDGRSGVVAVVRHPALCEALVALFEAVWERAAPVFTELREGIPDLDAEDHAILELLNAGMTDDVIGRQLGISERTVRRRVAGLAGRLGAGSRFQIGARAVRRGWLG